MVMRCVFKHHVYLCVVSTALMAGLALTSHTSKAYANQNCGSSGGGGAKTINDNVGPIVCDGDVTRTLSSTSGGDIKINMDTGPGKSAGAAVTVRGSGTNITIMKKITVKGSGGSGLPVIKVYGGGKLTLNEDVDVGGATIKKEIVVDGENSSVTLNGVLTGFEGVQVNNGGMVVLGEKVTGIEEVKVKINDGGMVNMMGDVAFNSVGGAGIQITGDGAGKATVMGVGSGKTVTMTVNGTGADGIQMDGAGKIDATVMGLKIVGSGGMGVEIEVKGGGTGIMVSGSGATVSMTQGKIMGKSGGNFGVQMMGGTGTVELTSVGIEGFKKGVEATNGTLKMMGGRLRLRVGRGILGCRWGVG
ncbi:hypothetical protein [Bartonella bovis]|nr:hypothetical protein [Bartonella bovis]